MGRPRKVVETKEEVKEIPKLKCSCCGKEKKEVEFYVSFSRMNKSRKRMSICKKCLLDMCKDLIEENDDFYIGVYRTCMYADIPYIKTLLISSVDEVEKEFGESIIGSINNKVSAFQRYVKSINSLSQYYGMTFSNGESENIEDIKEEKVEASLTKSDKQNEEDVIRILKYDPFESENSKDRKFLFNRLVDMLDDSVLGDNVKLMSVISIVKGFCQMEYIDKSIANITKNVEKLNKDNGTLKSLIDTKQKLNATILKACEDNGLSSKFNNNKSKGAGTLSGKIKELGELDLDEAKVNLFDIQTAQGMQQVADMSIKAINNQLMFDENDYSDILLKNRQMLKTSQENEEKLREENRLLKIKLNKLEKGCDS